MSSLRGRGCILVILNLISTGIDSASSFSHFLEACFIFLTLSQFFFGFLENMDPAELRYLEDEDTPTMKTIKGATTGFVAGTIWGTVVATWYDVPRVERNVALPGLIRTMKLMGNYGLTFAAIGGVYIGVEQLVQHYRMKRDFVNGAVGGFAAGASVLGFKGRSISTAISAGAALAFTSSILDAGGQTTRIDNGKEYYAYTTQKRPSAS